MTYAYFPGCSLHGMASEYDISARNACDRLGLTLREAPNWVCCGATPGHATDHLLSVALPAISLAEVWRENNSSSMVAACAACYSRLRTANEEIRRDPALRTQVQQTAEIDYAGQVEVRHLLDVLYRDLGPEAISARVTRPLEGLKVACYYGCLLVRPPDVVAFDDPEHPQIMDDLLAAAGVTCVEWPHKPECCGGNLSLTVPDVAVKLANDLLREARDAGADAIAVACPLCQSNLDLRQADVARAFGVRYDLPIFYFTQLLGLALGLEPKDLGLKRLIVSPRGVLQTLTSSPKEGT